MISEQRDDVKLADDADRVSYSLRMPSQLHSELKKASEQRGDSMNQLIVVAIANLLDRPELIPVDQGADIDSVIATAAVAGGTDAIGPIKGIAKHLANRGEPLLSAVLYSAAATVIEAGSGSVEAARELVHTGRLVQRARGGGDVAAALYRRGLHLDGENLEAMSLLGQRLHHVAQRTGDVEAYREAAKLLRQVADFDNYAQLFFGWSTLEVARADEDPALAAEGKNVLRTALRSWAFGAHDETERSKWLRQLRRLAALGEGDLVDELRGFANQHTRWSEITPEDATSGDGGE